MAYWNKAWEFEQKLVAGMSALGNRPRAQDVFELFITPWPDGLWKSGQPIHPDQTAISFTHHAVATLFAERTDLRWQRGVGDHPLPDPRRPETCRYE